MEEQLKKDKKTGGESEVLYQLPRNIRQIGQGENKVNVYIEDYVVSFVQYLGKKSTTEYKVAIFLGNTREIDEKKHVFIHGVMEVNDIKLEEGACFSKEIWKDIYQKIEENFKSGNIVGWLITKAGMSLEPTEQIEKIHTENFAGQEKVLMMYDSLEREENYYMYEGKKLKALSGYYIYYDRNHDMQEYMLKVKGVGEKEQVQDYALKQARKKLDKMVEVKQKKERVKFYIRGGIVVAALFLFGAGLKQQQTYRQTGKVWKNMIENEIEKEIPSQTPKKTATFIEEEPAKVTIAREKVKGDSIDEASNELEDVNKWETVEQYYIIQPGDTLVRICMEKFQSLEQMETIMEMNHIENKNKIVAGQKIKLWQ